MPRIIVNRFVRAGGSLVAENTSDLVVETYKLTKIYQIARSPSMTSRCAWSRVACSGCSARMEPARQPFYASSLVCIAQPAARRRRLASPGRSTSPRSAAATSAPSSVSMTMASVRTSVLLAGRTDEGHRPCRHRLQPDQPEGLVTELPAPRWRRRRSPRPPGRVCSCEVRSPPLRRSRQGLGTHSRRHRSERLGPFTHLEPVVLRRDSTSNPCGSIPPRIRSRAGKGRRCGAERWRRSPGSSVCRE